MGFNTTLVIYNDSLHHIARDVEIGRKIERACLSVGMNGEKPVDINYRDDMSCGSAGIAVETHHADGQTLVAVGGNTAQVISNYCGSYSENDKVALLRNVASELGYTLKKKPNRKR